MVTDGFYKPQNTFRKDAFSSNDNIDFRFNDGTIQEKRKYYWAWGKKDGHLAVDGFYLDSQSASQAATNLFPGIYYIHETDTRDSRVAVQQIKHKYAEYERDIFKGIEKAEHLQ